MQTPAHQKAGSCHDVPRAYRGLPKNRACHRAPIVTPTIVASTLWTGVVVLLIRKRCSHNLPWSGTQIKSEHGRREGMTA